MKRVIIAAAAVLSALGLSACDAVTQVGEVRNPSATIERDGAASAIVGGKVVWIFGDTFTPTGGVRNSAAYASVSDPTVVTDKLRNGVPHPAVPFNPTEQAANDANDGQWVIWPASVIPTASDRAVVLSTKFHATDAGWTDSSLVVSTLVAGETQTTRVAEPLASPESNFASGPFLHEGRVYLMDCGGLNVPPQLATKVMPSLPSTTDLLGWNGTGKCRLGRVRLADVADRSAYEFWTGAAWTGVSLTATPVVPGTNAGISVAWHPGWKKFVALSVPGFSKDIQLSTAPAITGPWTAPKTIFTAETNIYAVRIHPELSPANLSTMAITYFRQDQPGKKGGVVLATLKLDPR